MAERSARRDLGLFAVLAGLGVAVALSLSPSDPMQVSPAGCDRMALVDGVLRCEAARAQDTCGNSWRLRSGDVFESTSCEAPTRMPADELAALGVPVDPNSASADELESLRGIGPALAARIIEGRPYAAPQDLIAVKGIGPAKLAQIEPRLRF